MGTLAVGTSASDPALTEPDELAQKFAMLSVYYASIDDQFAIAGAPSVFLPPEVTPQPLAEALEVLSHNRYKLEQALWQIVRNTRIRQADDTESCYPPEVEPYLSLEQQEALDEIRAEYRMGASLLAACLRACHHDDRDLFDALRAAASARAVVENPGFARVAELLFDLGPQGFLERMERVVRDDDAWFDARQEIDLIEKEVGLGIASYIEYLAATAAYEAFVEGLDEGDAGADHPPLSIYPVVSRILQSTDQLWTSATVTTLAHGSDPRLLMEGTEPANWHDGSDVIKQSFYVDDPVRLGRCDVDIAPDGSMDALLYEEAAMSWGRDTSQQATFRNVLNVNRRVTAGEDERPVIDVEFSLCRSISSNVLWDVRAGGITLNEGFLRVVPLGNDRWRVTSRKLLRFSDRTPYSGATGWTDFGQMLNYLAPAALSWWVDTETYSLGQRASNISKRLPGNPAGEHEDEAR